MAKPTVSIGLRKGRLFVISTYSPGEAGGYIDKRPVFEVPPDEPECIGEAVLEAFKHYAVGGGMPDWNTYSSPVLEVAGLSSWSEYERGLKDCSISREQDSYHIYTELPHIYLPLDACPEEIGHSVLRALGTSTEKEAQKAERKRRTDDKR